MVLVNFGLVIATGCKDYCRSQVSTWAMLISRKR